MLNPLCPVSARLRERSAWFLQPVTSQATPLSTLPKVTALTRPPWL